MREVSAAKRAGALTSKRNALLGVGTDCDVPGLRKPLRLIWSVIKVYHPLQPSCFIKSCVANSPRNGPGVRNALLGVGTDFDAHNQNGEGEGVRERAGVRERERERKREKDRKKFL